MIRTATLNDADALAALHKICFEKCWTAQDFIQFLGNHCWCWIFENDQSIVGFLLIQSTGDDGDILSLAVDPAYRRRHVAERILQIAMMKLQSKVQSLFLDVSADNEAAVTLYKKLNFEIINTRVNYYQTKSGPKDALMLQKLLT